MKLEDACMRDGLRVYAIGDVHGCIDQLKALLIKIVAHQKNAPCERSKIIFLGDYVDRGPANKEVIDYLISFSQSEADVVFLKGNHDQRFEGFYKTPCNVGDEFMRWGGGPTLRDYGIVPHHGERFTSLGERLNKNLPASHRKFLENLEHFHVEGDYFFCHAGVRPGVELLDQKPQDLMWIRDDFLRATEPYEKIIVHGHTMCETPELMPNRINIDTGCYNSGCLTALVLEQSEKYFIHT